MTMPNFLIIGAAKSGTTSIFYYLQQHPEIYLSPQKETNFFAYEGRIPDYRWWGNPPTRILESITDIQMYQKEFVGVKEKAIGEASILYLYHPRAPERIFDYIPDVRIITILRNPVERAYSSYLNLRRDGREPHKVFLEALRDEGNRIKSNWAWDYYYQEFGKYHQQLLRYFNLFPESNIKVYLYDDLVSNHQALIKDIFNFLSVDDTFSPDFSIKYNPSGEPRSRIFQDLIQKNSTLKSGVKRILPQGIRGSIKQRLIGANLHKPPIEDDTYKYLLDLYHDEIVKLQKLINRDLTHWLSDYSTID